MNHHHHHHRLDDNDNSVDAEDDEFLKKRRRRRLDVVVFTYRWLIIQTIFVIIGLSSFVFVHHRKKHNNKNVLKQKQNQILLPIPSNPIYVNNTQIIKQQEHNLSSYLLLPNVLLVGAQKAGTTSVAEWLFTNGNVCRPKVFVNELQIPYNKEVHFFDNRYKTQINHNGGNNNNELLLLKENIEFYSKRYQHCLNNGSQQNHNNKLAMDATPDYLDKASLIRQFYDNSVGGNGNSHVVDTNLKIIIILREPISRELSLYNHLVNEYLQLKQENKDQIELDMHWSSMIVKQQEDDNNNDNNNNNNKSSSSNNINNIMSFEEHVEEHILPCIKPGYYYKTNTKSKTKKKKKKLFTSACYTSKKGGYATLIKEWFNLFDRRQILIISYDELKYNPYNALERIVIFLNLEDLFFNKTDNRKKREKGQLILPPITNENTQTSSNSKYKTTKPTCIIQERLSRIYNQWNNDLYDLLENNNNNGNNNENNQRLSIEQQPFPKFQLGDCQLRSTNGK